MSLKGGLVSCDYQNGPTFQMSESNIHPDWYLVYNGIIGDIMNEENAHPVFKHGLKIQHLVIFHQNFH
jgi:hypothetical protein